MGKSTEPPKCKVCGETHWGTCFQREAAKVFAPDSAQMKMAALAVQGFAKEHARPSPHDAIRPAEMQRPAEDVRLRKRGRPSTGFDKKEHDRIKAKERRDGKRLKLKEGK